MASMSYGAAEGEGTRESTRTRSPGWRVAAAVLVVGAVVATVAGMHMHRQAVALFQESPQLVADQGKLKTIEQGLMGLSGSRAMQQSRKAQALQQEIRDLKRGGVRVENLATVPGSRADFATRSVHPRRPAQHWMAQPSAEERGSFVRKASRPLHFGDNTAEPLDLTPEGMDNGNAQASVLANNLARWNKAHSASGKLAAARAAAVAPPGYVAVRAFEPGQRIPAGARVVSPQSLARVAAAAGGVFEEVSRPGARHMADSLMLLEGSNFSSADDGNMTVDGNSSIGNSSFEVVDAREPPPAPPAPVWVGNTNMTLAQLKAYAANLQNSAMEVMAKVTQQRHKALHSMAVGEGMVQRGWSKHLRAEEMLETAKNMTENATALMASYRWGVAGARASQSFKASKEMSEIAESLTKEASERGEMATKWMGLLDTLKNVNGEIVDPTEPLPGEPPIYGSGGANGTNATNATAVEGLEVSTTAAVV